MNKIYEKKLNRFNLKKIVAQKTRGEDNYRIAVRDLEGRFSRSEGGPVYILSNPTASRISPEEFERYEDRLKFGEANQLPTTIKFIRKFAKKWIVDVL